MDSRGNPEAPFPVGLTLMPSRFLLLAGAMLFAACTPGANEEQIDKDMYKEFRGGARLDPVESAELREKLGAVQSLGYFDGVKPAGDTETSVTFVDPELAWPGYNLYISGGQPEAILTDMLGYTLHRWHLDLEAAWPRDVLDQDPQLRQLVLDEDEGIEKKNSWQKAFLQPGGQLLVIFKDIGVAKIDRNSELIWKKTFAAHHDLDVAPDGEIFVIISEPRVLPRIDPERYQLDDFIAVLSTSGEELRRISIYEAFENSAFAPLLDQCEPSGDPFHTNSIQILRALPETDPPLPEAFKPGALLLSVREIDTIVLLDPESESVTWAKTGPWEEQHDATLLEGGTITLFDNFGNPETEHGESRAIEYDPARDRMVWEYGGSEENLFNSRRRGNVQRLPNGNTLINESDNGRAFEVLPDGRIAWEFINPSRAGENDRYIAVLRTFERLDPEPIEAWLNPESSGE